MEAISWEVIERRDWREDEDGSGRGAGAAGGSGALTLKAGCSAPRGAAQLPRARAEAAGVCSCRCLLQLCVGVRTGKALHGSKKRGEVKSWVLLIRINPLSLPGFAL